MTRRIPYYMAAPPDPYRTARKVAKVIVIVALVGLIFVFASAVPDTELVSRGLS